MALPALALLFALAKGVLAQSMPPSAPKDGSLQDIVVKGAEKDEPSVEKPAFDLSFDPYETVRPSLKTNDSWLLAESPALTGWARSRPQRLRDEHLIEPWNDLLQEASAIRIFPRKDALDALGGGDASKGNKAASWTLSLVDEDGKPFQSFSGKGAPSEELAWNGRSDRGEWILAGHSYSTVYRLDQSATASRTIMGQPLQFQGLVHEEERVLVVGLDSSALFGADRGRQETAASGARLLRSAADWIKRRQFGRSLRVRAFANDAGLASGQAAAVKAYLAQELAVPAERIAAEGLAAPASEQRVDLLIQ